MYVKAGLVKPYVWSVAGEVCGIDAADGVANDGRIKMVQLVQLPQDEVVSDVVDPRVEAQVQAGRGLLALGQQDQRVIAPFCPGVDLMNLHFAVV
jgi:hypothetical protein